MNHLNIYDAFSGIDFFKTNSIVQFIQKHQEETWVSQEAILHAVNYATKEVPSFGGFILTIEENNEFQAVLVVNKTGMSGYMPDYIAVLNANTPTMEGKNAYRNLVENAIHLTKNKISSLIKDFGQKELMLEGMEAEAKLLKINQNQELLVKASA